MLNSRHTSVAAALAAALALGAVTAPATAGDTVRPNSFWWPEQLDLGPLRDHDRAPRRHTQTQSAQIPQICG